MPVVVISQGVKTVFLEQMLFFKIYTILLAFFSHQKSQFNYAIF